MNHDSFKLERLEVSAYQVPTDDPEADGTFNLTALLIYSFMIGRDLTRTVAPEAWRITVIGRQWWWEVTMPARQWDRLGAMAPHRAGIHEQE